MHADPSKLDASAVDGKTGGGSLPSTGEFILNALPQSTVGAFAENSLLQVLVLARLVGAALLHLVGECGLGVIKTYGKLIVLCYAVALLFLALLAVALKAVTGLSLWKFVRCTREEMLHALGTASSETVMPRMMQKLRQAGCRDDAVGLVLPTGYSFNLDGASIYLSIGTLFIAQAVGVDLSLGQQITVVLVLMLTSKGMAGVPGSAFLALSATASSMLDGEIAFVEEDDEPRTEESPTEGPGPESAKADIPARSTEEPTPEVG